jgi:hypothetical protein
MIEANPPSPLPKTIAETFQYLGNTVLEKFAQEVTKKQLFYHNEDHIRAVERRSQEIFAVVSPELDADLTRSKLLLNFCAIAHDMVQEFDDTADMPRRRESGVSEKITIEQLIQLIDQLNAQIDPIARLTSADTAIIQQAIRATICTYDSQTQGIYQTLLHSGESLSIVSRILALADLGTLGMEGVEAFNREGSLLFLEENPDVVTLLQSNTLQQHSELAESIRQRLLKRSRFQVNFAKSRLALFNQELKGFPEKVIPVLLTNTFRHLSPATIQAIETSTPTDPETSLNELLEFFQFEQYLIRES